MPNLDKEDLEYSKEDDFSEIRARHEEEEIDSRLKRQILWGYSPKHVNQIIEQYKSMLSMMENSYENRLKDVQTEMERLFNERSVIRQQLNDELEKSRRLEAYRTEAEEYRQQTETLQKQLSELEESRKQAQEELEHAREDMRIAQEDGRQADRKHSDMLDEFNRTKRDYEELNSRYLKAEKELETLRDRAAAAELDRQAMQEQLAAQEGSEGAGGESETVRQLRQQLNSLTEYAASLEKRRDSMENQLNSLTVINREMEKLAKEYAAHREEMQEYRAKCRNLQQDKDRLMNEMESTGTVLSEIMEQVEEKEKERESLKQKVAQQNAQLLAVMREKLDLQDEQLKMTKHVYELENRLSENTGLYEQAQGEIKELKKRCEELEKGKIIQLSAAGKERGKNGTDRTDCQPAADDQTEFGMLQEKSRILAERISQLRQAEERKRNSMQQQNICAGRDSRLS